MQAFLQPYKVLELSDERAMLCGKFMADLGADVIVIEKPGGSVARSIGPFYRDISSPESSLHWFAYNLNKKGITLDIEKENGQAIFKRLVQEVDFIIESFPPGYMDNLGLGYEALSSLNPRIIMASVTPFGQKGPYRDYKASDLGCTAASGYMYLCGDINRAPLRISYPQSYNFASVHAMAGMLTALNERHISGKGQHVDVSVQESLCLCMLYGLPYWYISGLLLRRQGPYLMRPQGLMQRQLWPCKEGYVNFLIIGGPPGAKANQALVEWMESEGAATLELKEMVWSEFSYDGIEPQKYYRIQDAISQFFLRFTATELFKEAIERGIWIFPVYTTHDILHDRQLSERNTWIEVPHSELRTQIKYPGLFFKSPGITYEGHRAPLIGEHNVEIYQRLGLSKDEINRFKQDGII